MPGFNLADYETVESRIAAFWHDYPDGRISTDLISHSPTDYIVAAAVYRKARDAKPVATGLAQETVTERGVNFTSALENCETSAIGRALANMGYATRGKRPSREEMEKVERMNAPAKVEELQKKIKDAKDVDKLRAVGIEIRTANVPDVAKDVLRDDYETRKRILEAVDAV